MDYKPWIILTFLFFGIAELVLGRFFNREKTSAKDVIIEGICSLTLPLLIIPMTLMLSGMAVDAIAPNAKGTLAHWPWWLMFVTFLLADDLTQYGWHRLSHTVPWLYGLHRAHHSAEYMSIRIVYRNNILYYAMMPGLWLSGALIHLGMGSVYVWYIIIKMSVIIAAHSSVPWDEPLYRWRWSRPLMWLLERVISTPSTHSAHHGLNKQDGVTHYHGNYGNFLFLWDVIFGTAKITRKRPEAYGIENMDPGTLFEELIFPFRVPREHQKPMEAVAKTPSHQTEANKLC